MPNGIAVKVVKEQKNDAGQHQLLLEAVDGGKFFVVSYSKRYDETAVFPASSDGEITSFDPLGETGGKSFHGALQDAGMYIVQDDVATSVAQVRSTKSHEVKSMSTRRPQFIKVRGQLYKLAETDPMLNTALLELKSGQNAFSKATTPDEIAAAKAKLTSAAQNLLSALQ